MNTLSSRARLGARSGFTLVEMLIVIAVIAILAAILLPVFGRVRESGRRTACASNMKQLGMAFQQYAQDANDRLPGAWDGPTGETKTGGWIYYTQFGKPVALDSASATDKASFDVTKGSLFSYVKSTGVYLCPSDAYGPKAGVNGLSYAINACITKQKRDAAGTRDLSVFMPGKKVNSIKNPTQFMLLAEEVQPGSAGSGAYLDNSSTDDGYFNLPRAVPDEESHKNFLALRHNDGGNVAFIDGHVKWYKREQILERKFQIGGEGDLAKGCPEFQNIAL